MTPEEIEKINRRRKQLNINSLKYYYKMKEINKDKPKEEKPKQKRGPKPKIQEIDTEILKKKGRPRIHPVKEKPLEKMKQERKHNCLWINLTLGNTIKHITKVLRLHALSATTLISQLISCSVISKPENVLWLNF